MLKKVSYLLLFFQHRDHNISLLIFVQYVDLKRIEKMKVAKVKISLKDRFKDTTEVSCICRYLTSNDMKTSLNMFFLISVGS